MKRKLAFLTTLVMLFSLISGIGTAASTPAITYPTVQAFTNDDGYLCFTTSDKKSTYNIWGWDDDGTYYSAYWDTKAKCYVSGTTQDAVKDLRLSLYASGTGFTTSFTYDEDLLPTSANKWKSSSTYDDKGWETYSGDNIDYDSVGYMTQRSTDTSVYDADGNYVSGKTESKYYKDGELYETYSSSTVKNADDNFSESESRFRDYNGSFKQTYAYDRVRTSDYGTISLLEKYWSYNDAGEMTSRSLSDGIREQNGQYTTTGASYSSYLGQEKQTRKSKRIADPDGFQVYYESTNWYYDSDGSLLEEYTSTTDENEMEYITDKYYNSQGKLRSLNYCVRDNHGYTKNGEYENRYYDEDGNFSSAYRNESFRDETVNGRQKYTYTSKGFHIYEDGSERMTSKHVEKEDEEFNAISYVVNSWYYDSKGVLTGSSVSTRQNNTDGSYKSTDKSYNAQGILTYESVSQTDGEGKYSEEDRYYDGSTGYMTSERITRANGDYETRNYDRKTGKLTYEYIDKEDAEGVDTYSRKYCNSDGTLRRRVEYNNQSATETTGAIYTTTYYNAADKVAVVEKTTYEKDSSKCTTVYTDGSGKVLGTHQRDENGNDSGYTPTINQRTGEIRDYSIYSKVSDDRYETKYYDANGALKSTSVDRYTDDGWISEDYHANRTTPYYTYEGKYNSETGKYEYFSKDFANSGVLICSSKQSGDDHFYYNEKGELVYSTTYDADGYTEYKNPKGEIFAWKGYDDPTLTDYYTWVNTNRRGYIDSATYTVSSGSSWPDIGETSTSTYTETSFDSKLQKISTTKETTVATRTEEKLESTTTNEKGIVTGKGTQYFTADGSTKKSINSYYDSTTGAFTHKQISIYQSDLADYVYKYYNEHSNLTQYELENDRDGYYIYEAYYPDGTLMRVEKYDNLENDTSESTHYDRKGNLSYTSISDENGSVYTHYYSNGQPSTIRKSTNNYDGTRTANTTYYNSDGKITQYDWNQVYSEDWIYDMEVWDATKILYTVHHEDAAEYDGYSETLKDTAGNVMNIEVDYDAGTDSATVTFANAKDGWIQAFGGWYYLQGGKQVTGWKKIDGVWYWFDQSGQMAAYNHYVDGALYSFNSDGSWNASGWSDSGYTYVDASGTAVTGWKKIDGKWYWADANGYLATDGGQTIWNEDGTSKEVYFFNADGTWDTAQGWKEYDGNRYFYDASGNPVKGWKLIDNNWYFFNNAGVMRNGWVGNGGKTYYMNVDGTMATGWVQDVCESEWYYLDENGILKRGWQEINGKWYYMKDDGAMAEGEWVKSGDKRCYIDADGHLVTGWAEIDNNWYYMDEDGYAKTGWLQSGSNWFYMKPDGTMAADEWVGSGDKRCYIDANGHMASGWQSIGGYWYYLNDDGYIKTGWLQSGSNWYCFGTDGKMLTGWQEINGTRYYFAPDGKMQTAGWVENGGSYFYLADGKVKTGWLQSGSNWYYLSSTGRMSTGWKDIGDSRYYFDADGRMQTGWVEDGGDYYYLDSTGKMQTGWVQSAGKWYYMYENGRMASDCSININGKVYEFDSNGVCLNP